MRYPARLFLVLVVGVTITSLPPRAQALWMPGNGPCAWTAQSLFTRAAGPYRHPSPPYPHWPPPTLGLPWPGPQSPAPGPPRSERENTGASE
jgi:hypothetical protein